MGKRRVSKIMFPVPNVALSSIKLKKESIRFYSERFIKYPLSEHFHWNSRDRTLEEMGLSVKRWRHLNRSVDY